MGTGGRAGGGGGGGASLGSGQFNENQTGTNAQSIIGGNYLNSVPVTNRSMRNHVMGNAQVAGEVVGRLNEARRSGRVTENVTYRTTRIPHAVSPGVTNTGPGESYVTTVNVGRNTTLRVITSQSRGGGINTQAQVLTGRGRQGIVRSRLNLNEGNGSSRALDRRRLADDLISRL